MDDDDDDDDIRYENELVGYTFFLRVPTPV